MAQDHAEALRWFHKAAEQGVARAQSSLVDLYVGGEGVPLDDVLAYMWASIVTASWPPGETRDRFAEGLDKLAARMTPDQIAEAQRRAREWLATHGEAGQN